MWSVVVSGEVDWRLRDGRDWMDGLVRLVGEGRLSRDRWDGRFGEMDAAATAEGEAAETVCERKRPLFREVRDTGGTV